MTEKTNSKITKRRGIYLLPNLFTTFGIFCGFYGIVASMSGHFADAAFALFIAMLMDSFDGRVARMTNTTSDFGAEYDSLADIVSFGVAPALIAYNWAHLEKLEQIGWLAAFIYVVCGALRLARFNVMPETVDKKYFQGLPIPAAAAVIIGLVWFGEIMEWNRTSMHIPVAIVITVCGFLMVSNFRYHSFKEVDWKGKVPFVSMLLMVLVIVMVASNPPIVLFPVFALYLLSGPIVTLRLFNKVKSERKKDNNVDD
ncbi:MAG: CDP-diacylglycerol--serine O-phosphatidyltransferase [Gammaproteobacteria bacterium]|nr:CDP-diacylglycerol--serine O-phosphatidyltransferase [Gammaproteobacteria bacterium]